MHLAVSCDMGTPLFQVRPLRTVPFGNVRLTDVALSRFSVSVAVSGRFFPLVTVTVHQLEHHVIGPGGPVYAGLCRQ